jgi:hypothetical protein
MNLKHYGVADESVLPETLTSVPANPLRMMLGTILMVLQVVAVSFGGRALVVGGTLATESSSKPGVLLGA